MTTTQLQASTTRSGAHYSFLRLLSCVRLDEILLLNGSPLLGAILSMGRMTLPKAAAICLLAAANSCLVAHVFLLNDWSGIDADLLDERRKRGVFTGKGVGRTAVVYFCIALLLLSLLLFSPFGLQTTFVAFVIAALSALYSVPGIHMKGMPLLNSLLHLSGGILHFLLGYSLFKPIDGRSIGIACFFGLTFVAGHLTHEARDRDADLLNGIATNAVRFGRAYNFIAGFLIFTVAYILLVALAVRGVLPSSLILASALYPFHLYWFLQAIRSELTFETIQRVQMRYRVLYAVIGVSIAAVALK